MRVVRTMDVEPFAYTAQGQLWQKLTSEWQPDLTIYAYDNVGRVTGISYQAHRVGYGYANASHDDDHDAGHHRGSR